MPKKISQKPNQESSTKTESPEEKRMAIIEVSGKQFLVKTGSLLTLDNQNQEPGQKIETEKVLLTLNDGNISVGQPYVKGAKVGLEVLENIKGKKIEIIKYKAKSRYRRHTGYRSRLTKVRVASINF